MEAGENDGGLNYGLGRHVAHDWPPLAEHEVADVLASYPLSTIEPSSALTTISWRSPRPQASAALLETGATTLFMKRHHRSLRSANDLHIEHAFAEHLLTELQQVPRVMFTREGSTTVERGEFIYELHQFLSGSGLYRDARPWSPFRSASHANSAGMALARLHQAARRFLFPPRLPGVLTNSSALVAANNPTVALRHLMNLRPDLARSRVAEHLEEDFARHHLEAVNAVSPFLAVLEPQWGHGDWHPSNLAWSTRGADATVVGVFDLGLANRTFALHDLALALTRSTIDWLDLADRGEIGVDVAGMDALLDGYNEVNPLRAYEEQALIGLLPVVHIEHALSEVEYYSSVVDDPTKAGHTYESYFIGHTRWFNDRRGAAVIDHLRSRFSASTATTG